MTIVYATTDDLATWTGSDAPENALSLLRSASLLVTQATVAAYYKVDATTGLPTEPTLLQAFNDATCAQVTTWIATGVDPNAAGLLSTAIVRARGIGTARLDYDTSLSASVTAFQARQKIASQLCAESARILQAVALIITAPWIA